MLDSQKKHTFVEPVGTWNGDLGDFGRSMYRFVQGGAFWRGPGSWGGHEKIEFACNVETWVKKHAKK